MKALIVALGCVGVSGCGSDTISRQDADKNKEAFSQAAYEDAMRNAGRSAELQQEKDAAEARRSQEGR
jgi:hypothetical protein